MGKPKRIRKTRGASALGSDDEGLYRDLRDPNPKARDYVYSEIDEFNNNRDQIPLDSDDDDHPVPRTLHEEVLPIADDSGDESDADDDDFANDFHSRMLQKDEIASDVEDNDDDGLPNEKAWGKKRSVYYNTDYVDKDYDGYQGSDIEMAEAEEKEAMKIQKRLLQELSEEDFGLDWIAPVHKSAQQTVDACKEKVATNLSALSENEKLQLLKKESPELMYVLKDFEIRMNELKDKILPLIPLVEDGKIPPGPGADYLMAKQRLIYQYCTNIGFYLTIRCKDVNVRNHPVVKRLLSFRKLLDQLDPIGKTLDEDIEAVLKVLREGKEVKPSSQALPSSESESETETRLLKKPKRNTNNMSKNKKKKVSFAEEVVDDAESDSDGQQKEAIEDYNPLESSGDEDMEGMEPDNKKREITYEIAKNKGLTPHRKKEYRNPRVRHRIKFQKAKVRRKGQYKEPKTELQRYGGEVSGIRIGTKRGIKLK